MVFKKDLTPIGGKRGVVSKVNGKGAAERPPQMLPRITGRYPKQAPLAPAPTPMPTSAPPMMGPPPPEEV